MKKELFSYKILIDSISKTNFFKIIFFLSIVIVFYGYLLGDNMEKDYINSILFPYSFNYFNMCFFALLLLNTFNNYLVMETNYNYLIRLKNRKNYIKSLLSVNILVNIIWALIIFILIVCCNTVFRFRSFNIFYTIESYGISNIVYALFYFFRYHFFSLYISTIFILFILKFKKIVSYIFIFAYIIGFLFMNNTVEIISSFQFLPWKYYSIINYSSFMLEVCYSLLFCIILEIFVIFLYIFNTNKICLKRFSLYFLFSDLQYLVQKNKIAIIILLLCPLAISYLLNYSLDGNYIFQMSLGLNIESENKYIISVLYYLVNIISCIYIFLVSFIKDYNNISNIFLRYNYKKYYYIKCINNIIIIILLKGIQYFMLFINVRFILNHNCGNGIINLFLNDLSLITFLGFLTLFFYLLYKIVYKSKFCVLSLGFVCFYIFVINQLNVSKICSIFFYY